MVASLAPVWALLISVAFLLMGNGLQGTLLPVRAQLENFSSLEIGILGSSYFLGFALGCLLAPRAVKRVGHIRVFTAMVAIASAVSIAHAILLSPLIWWIFRAMTGFCFAALYMVIESWLGEKSTNETRGFVFSVYTFINLTVITAGQMMLTMDSPLSFTLFGMASILVSLAAVPVAMTKAAAPQPIVAVRVRPLQLFRTSPVGFFGCLAVGLASGAFWSLGPVFAQREEGNVTAIALFMSFAVIAGAMGQYPFGKASDRMDRRVVLILVSTGAALASVGLVLASRFWTPGLLLTTACFGFFAFSLYPIAVAHMNDFIEPDGFVEAASGLLLIYAAGAVVGPLIASGLMQYFGAHALFVFTAVIYLATAFYAIYRMRKRAPAPEEERVPFIDSIRLAQTVSSVNPLSEAASPIDSPIVRNEI